MEIKNARILVTGGLGFIGSHIVERLLNENAKEVIILDNYSHPQKLQIKKIFENKKNLKIIKGDIKDNVLLHKICKNIDFVFHKASILIPECHHNPRQCLETNIIGAFNVFEACVLNKVKKIIFASTATVYGEPESLPMKETHPFNNRTFYGASKIANEQFAKAFREKYGLNYIGFRYFNVYGPRMNLKGFNTSILINWLDKMEKDELPIIFGEGKQAMDFIYIDDVVEANIKALKKSIDEGIYNIGSGKATNLNSLFKLMSSIVGFKKKPIYIKPPNIPLISIRQADINKAREELNFVAKTDLKSGLKKLIDWKQKQA